MDQSTIYFVGPGNASAGGAKASLYHDSLAPNISAAQPLQIKLGETELLTGKRQLFTQLFNTLPLAFPAAGGTTLHTPRSPPYPHGQNKTRFVQNGYFDIAPPPRISPRVRNHLQPISSCSSRFPGENRPRAHLLAPTAAPVGAFPLFRTQLCRMARPHELTFHQTTVIGEPLSFQRAPAIRLSSHARLLQTTASASQLLGHLLRFLPLPSFFSVPRPAR